MSKVWNNFWPRLYLSPTIVIIFKIIEFLLLIRGFDENLLGILIRIF